MGRPCVAGCICARERRSGYDTWPTTTSQRPSNAHPTEPQQKINVPAHALPEPGVPRGAARQQPSIPLEPTPKQHPHRPPRGPRNFLDELWHMFEKFLESALGMIFPALGRERLAGRDGVAGTAGLDPTPGHAPQSAATASHELPHAASPQAAGSSNALIEVAAARDHFDIAARDNPVRAAHELLEHEKASRAKGAPGILGHIETVLADPTAAPGRDNALHLAKGLATVYGSNVKPELDGILKDYPNLNKAVNKERAAIDKRNNSAETQPGNERIERRLATMNPDTHSPDMAG